MNQLTSVKRAQILHLLLEDVSMRAVSRITGVSFNTVAKLLTDAGDACLEYHDHVVRSVHSSRVQVDEVWSFCYAKRKNVPTATSAPEGAGDVWTWTAIDADTKLLISYLVGLRSVDDGCTFMLDLRSRLASWARLESDGLKAYPIAVDKAFGNEVAYQQTEANSFVERQNLTMRMHMRRFTRKTNGFSKRIEQHIAMTALYAVYYNFCRLHQTLKTTPAVAARVTHQRRDLAWIVSLIEARAPKTGPRGPYRKRKVN